MRQVNPLWKLLTAVFSVLLTVLVWQQGLQESFNRPSFAPKLSIKQHEMAVVASPSLPESIKELLIGIDPKAELRELLREISTEDLQDRDRIILASLEESADKRIDLLDPPMKDEDLRPIKQALLNTSGASTFSIKDSFLIDELKKDQLLYQVSCFALGGDESTCLDRKISDSFALRLIFIQFLPILTTGFGVILLIRQAWLFIRRKNIAWPALSETPLSLVDMTLLICGGFVVLGEIIFPAVIVPLSSIFTKSLPLPIGESLKVFIGYGAMTIPPLVILRMQLQGLENLEIPSDGWLQWRIKPINTSLIKAIGGWLMIMPFVLVTGWLMNLFWGDQGGSNPLLDLVLSSHNHLALLLLFITTVFFAPVFEELIFRGALLPVVAKKFGRSSGVIISSLVFALAHLSVGEFPPLFVLGIGLGVLRVSSGRLFPCAIMHSLWNGVTFTNLLLLAA